MAGILLSSLAIQGFLFGMCPRVADDSRCADDEDAPQVAAALLGDPAEPRLADISRTVCPSPVSSRAQ